MIPEEAGPEQSMKSAAMSGGRWNLIEAVLVQLTGVATTFVLARLLAPEDFGIIAIVAVVTGFFALLTQVGLGAALVQRKELAPGELSTAFWAAAALGAVVVVAGWALAAPIAASFESPDAAPFLVVAPLGLLFGLIATVPRAILLRALKFRIVSIILIVGSVLYAVLAIGLAATTELGVWSIIIAQVARRLFQLVATQVATRWRPRLVFDFDLLKRDLAFTANFLLGQGGMYLVKNVDYWVVRRTTDDATLGVYYVAYVLPTILRQRISWALGRIMLPVLSRIREDRPRFATAYFNILRLLSMVAFPLMIGLATVTHVVVPVAFGPGWEGAINPMAILALGAAVDSLWQASSTMLVTDGRPGLTVWIVGVRLLVVVVGLAIAAQVGGLEAIAVAVAVGALVSAAAGQTVVARRIDASWSDFWSSIRPSLLPTVTMAAAVMGLRALLADAGLFDVVELIALVAVGASTYLGAGFLLHRPAFREAFSDAKRLVAPSKSS